MEHLEEAGIHSGDSACTLPPVTLGPDVLERVRQATGAIAAGVGVRGLINIQFALAADILYVIEANPRASRTVPFVSKATGVQLAKAAALIGTGVGIRQLRADGVLLPEGDGSHLPDDAAVAVKEAVLPFARFRTAEGRAVDSLLGPEMRSTGEVMGFDEHYDTAFAKAQAGAGVALPSQGRVFVSVANKDKRAAVAYVRMFRDLGFEIVTTGGTAKVLRRNGIDSTVVAKISDRGSQERTVVDLIENGEIDLVFNTPSSGGDSRGDGYEIRAAATSVGMPIVTTVAQLGAVVQAVTALREHTWDVTPLQVHEQRLRASVSAARESAEPARG
jgi:carbamoyl-phosphate synthase large subunit